MARQKKGIVPDVEHGEYEPTPSVGPVLKKKVEVVRRKGLTEAHFHQGVTIRFDNRSAGFNNVNINNPTYRDLSLEFSDQFGPCIKVTSEKNKNLACYVPMANVRYTVVEE